MQSEYTFNITPSYSPINLKKTHYVIHTINKKESVEITDAYKKVKRTFKDFLKLHKLAKKDLIYLPEPSIINFKEQNNFCSKVFNFRNKNYENVFSLEEFLGFLIEIDNENIQKIVKNFILNDKF